MKVDKLPMKRSKSFTEHIAFRATKEWKQRYDRLKGHNVDTQELLRIALMEAISDAEKKLGIAS